MIVSLIFGQFQDHWCVGLFPAAGAGLVLLVYAFHVHVRKARAEFTTKVSLHRIHSKSASWQLFGMGVSLWSAVIPFLVETTGLLDPTAKEVLRRSAKRAAERSTRRRAAPDPGWKLPVTPKVARCTLRAWWNQSPEA